MSRQFPILLAAAALALAGAGCGKKGPPLAPIVHIPAAVEKVTAARVGNDVYLTVTIPGQNIDKTTPADVARVDIFAATTLTPPPRTRLFEIATKVASIDVAPPVRPGEPPPPPPAAGTVTLPPQGAAVVVRDSLTAATLAPLTLRELPAARGTVALAAPATSPTAASAPSPSFPRRYYIAVAVSDKGRQGPPGPMVELPLTPLPEPPAHLEATVTSLDSVVLTWEPSGGVVGFLVDTPRPVEQAPVDEPAPDPVTAAARAAATLPPGPTLYNVYRDLTPAPPAPLAPPAPTPLNAAPLAALTFTDSGDVEVGRERCYTVRAVRGAGPGLVISEPSSRVCLMPEDRFPPEAPTNLLATVDPEGGIALIWEPNGEADLAGYVVLRGQAGDATLRSVTAAPIMDTRYVDKDVTAGMRYVYAIQAVDTHGNASERSNQAEETAR